MATEISLETLIEILKVTSQEDKKKAKVNKWICIALCAVCVLCLWTKTLEGCITCTGLAAYYLVRHLKAEQRWKMAEDKIRIYELIAPLRADTALLLGGYDHIVKHLSRQ